MSTVAPRTLYKYYPPERLDILDTWSVRFTHPSQFNDAFDTDYTIHDKRSIRDQLFPDTVPGVFCMTSGPDNHLMWVNYAAQHRGFVMGFNSLANFFMEDGGVLQKVEYQSTPPDIPFDSEPPLELCFIKSDDWSYEREWRCVRQFPRSGMTGVSTSVIFPHYAVVEIIIGWKMASSGRIRVFQFADIAGVPIAIYESAPDRRTWTFAHKPTKCQLCKECDGVGTVMP